MSNKNELNTDINFKEKYKNLNNNEIREILKQRNLYQQAAVEAAIQEAISRGIINSEQDLFSEEYKIDTNSNMLFFPNIQDKTRRDKIIGSLGRTNYIIGLFPLIFAFIKYAEGNISHMVAFAMVGIFWMGLNFQLLKSKKVGYSSSMLILVFLSIAYTAYMFSQLKTIQVMDVFVALILFTIPIYCILYLRKLMQTEKNTHPE